jgi:serine/threonine-protein kinase
MDPNAIALARELADFPAQEREAFYERASVPPSLRLEIEALVAGLLPQSSPSGNSSTPAPDISGTRGLQPTLIGRYNVIRLLGRGGMGEVYLAHDPVLDREVAVKLIGAGLDDANARHRLVQEARAAGRLRHPNIVTIFDAGEHGGNSYIAMEHLSGETVRSLIQRRAPFSPGRKLALMEGACAGLAHAHRANVVHFDVKPDNLMLDARGVLKVLDFGVARVLKSEVLVTQHVAGTLRYMSPEQLSGGALDRRSDVFSLGCSLFEFVAYEPAYVGSPHELIARITRGPVPRLSDVLPWVDPALDALVARAMALDPSQRFDDLDELADALRRFREQLDPMDEPWPAAPATAGSVSPRRAAVTPVTRPQRATLAAIGAATALAVGSAAVWFWRPAPEAEQKRGRESFSTASIEKDSRPLFEASQPSTAGAGQTAPSPRPTAPAERDAPDRPSATGNVKAPAAAGTRGAPLSAEAHIPTDDAGALRARLQPSIVETPPPIASPPPGAGLADNTKPSTPPAGPAAPANDVNDVLATLRRYCEAYANLDASALQRVYPGLGPSQIAQLRKTFESTTEYEVEVGDPRVDVRNNAATVRTVVTRKIVPRVGSAQSSTAPTEFRLQRDARGWVITSVRAGP